VTVDETSVGGPDGADGAARRGAELGGDRMGLRVPAT
jgi:hypothetical protein